MKALILGAGKGTRLKRLTEKRPKPMLPIRGKPLLQHTLEWLRSYGICEVAINVHYHPNVIMSHFGDGAGLGMKIHYSQEDTLLGTAGAARQLDWFFREDLQDDFVVVYGDVLTNLNLSRLIELHRCKAGEGHEAAAMTMALYRVPDPTQCGVVSLDQTGRVTRFVEKPAPDQVFTDLAFSGVMVCGSSILDAIPAGRVFDFGHDCIPALLADGAVMYGQPIAGDEFLVDIGTLEGYLAALSLRRYQIA